MRLLTFVLNALWEEACHIENGSSFHSFGPEYVKVFLKSSVYCSLHANPLARSLEQVKLDLDKWKLWKNLFE
jgi:hypothetical protein